VLLYNKLNKIFRAGSKALVMQPLKFKNSKCFVASTSLPKIIAPSFDISLPEISRNLRFS